MGKADMIEALNRDLRDGWLKKLKKSGTDLRLIPPKAPTWDQGFYGIDRSVRKQKMAWNWKDYARELREQEIPRTKPQIPPQWFIDALGEFTKACAFHTMHYRLISHITIDPDMAVRVFGLAPGQSMQIATPTGTITVYAAQHPDDTDD